MEEKRYKYIIDNSKDSITLINRDYVYELANETYCEDTSRCQEEIVGHTVADVWGREKFERTIKGYIDRCFAGENVNYVEEFSFGPFLKYMHILILPLTMKMMKLPMP
ncbi:MAG: PAS domain S-box protein [Spirochaetia bacterium]|nr:PAS domain S-box protein [Spirochaetia bacterium]